MDEQGPICIMNESEKPATDKAHAPLILLDLHGDPATGNFIALAVAL